MNNMNMSDKEPLYVVGFPKSGNTWLARLLAEVTDSKIAVSNSSDVVNNADNTQERKGNFLIHKVHVSENEEKLLDNKTVYIVRDVRDVLVSGFFHVNRWADNNNFGFCFKLYFSHEVRKLNKKWQGNYVAEILNTVKLFARRLAGRKYTKIRVGSWSQHVDFWSNQERVVVTRYEDLLEDTESELKRILNTIGILTSEVKIKQAVFNQSFKKKKADFKAVGDYKNVEFMRSGRVAGWREFLSPAQVRMIEKTHGDIMGKFGYALEGQK